MVKKFTKEQIKILLNFKSKNWSLFDYSNSNIVWQHKKKREEVSISYYSSSWYIFLPSPYGTKFKKEFGEYKVESLNEAIKVVLSYMRTN